MEKKNDNNDNCRNRCSTHKNGAENSKNKRIIVIMKTMTMVKMVKSSTNFSDDRKSMEPSVP